MNLQFIDAGQFRSLLSLQENQPVFNDTGGYLEQWTEIATLWGRIEPKQSGSQVFAGQHIPHVTHLITIRYRSDISSPMRLTRGGRVFTVLGLHDPDESQRYLICSVREEIR
ncbi:phage head closure protein [Pseudochrobactrum sp. sp1633]|uniref:phage head closure protein n=1 Tax=Pseudochrobactrum sp. sp1633 TaxID=3036706 RepID=UPI0025A4F0A6|nr:phage head closure protein [Pseudochrobactrum sp. sp1633]MDM8345174.1 phage head closure protein [Pseudochrobactrum sp. sp1633]HWD12975.1 phage head closure protein [Pseudochrobactrum sp.]